MNRKGSFTRAALATAAMLFATDAAVAACSAPEIDTLYSVVRVSATPGVVASGVVIAPGWVLTAAHVVEGTSGLNVSAALGEPRRAKLRSINAHLDLALLATDTNGLTPIAISAEPMRSGEPVWAAGYPRAGELTISSGHYQNVLNGRLQTDAYIDSGQSGGALFSCRQGTHYLAGIVHGFLAIERGDKVTNTGESVSVAAGSVRQFLDIAGYDTARN